MSSAPLRGGFIPLCKAPWEFASRRLKDMYLDLEERPPLKLPNPQSSNWAEALEAFGVRLQHSFRTEPAIREMREHVRDMLGRGKLEARGVKKSPELANDQQPIPHYYFLNAKPDWDNNIVESLGCRYEAVEIRRAREKVISKHDICEVLPAPHLNVSGEDKRGRPSKDHLVIEAIRELERRGHDFRVSQKNSRYTILDFLRFERGVTSLEGLSESVLSRCIRTHVRTLQKGQKL
jgi:hypothetical protein